MFQPLLRDTYEGKTDLQSTGQPHAGGRTVHLGVREQDGRSKSSWGNFMLAQSSHPDKWISAFGDKLFGVGHLNE